MTVPEKGNGLGDGQRTCRDEGDGGALRAGGVVRAVAGADAASVLVEGPVEAELLRGDRAALTLRLASR